MFISELLSRYTKIINNIQQNVDKYGLQSMESEKKFFRDLKKFAYMSSDYTSLLESMNNPEKQLSSK